jgi:hypothetical protein
VATVLAGGAEVSITSPVNCADDATDEGSKTRYVLQTRHNEEGSDHKQTVNYKPNANDSLELVTRPRNLQAAMVRVRSTFVSAGELQVMTYVGK